MSQFSAFSPQGPTVLVGVTAVQAQPAGASVMGTSYRVRCLATAYLTWGATSSVTAVGAPTAGVPSANTIGMSTGTELSWTFPGGSWFIASVAAAFELTPGEGV